MNSQFDKVLNLRNDNIEAFLIYIFKVLKFIDGSIRKSQQLHTHHLEEFSFLKIFLNFETWNGHRDRNVSKGL